MVFQNVTVFQECFNKAFAVIIASQAEGDIVDKTQGLETKQHELLN